MKIGLLLFGLVFTTQYLIAQKTLTPQSDKSKVHFVIKNIGINTGGDIGGIEGEIIINEKDISKSKAAVSVKVETIDTDNERRDKHLRNADYFDVEKYPTIRIVSSSITKNASGNGYIFTGSLTIRATTKNISFPFVVLKNSEGYLLSGEFSINRLDYGVGKNSSTLSDTVKVELSIFAK